MAGLLKEITDLPSVTEVTAGLGDFLLIKQGDTDRRIRVRDIFKFHTENTSNPHSVTKTQVGLDKINNWEETIDYEYSLDDKYANIGAVRRLAEAFEVAVSNAVPTGIVSMWSGSIANIPDGYALCDGDNGTPDLLDRFVVGAGDTYVVGSRSGSATTTHSHSVSTGNTSLSIAQIPSHRHALTYWQDASEINRGITGTVGGGESSARNGTTYTEYTGSGAGHSHTASSASSEIDNRPPYYALCYIMKL